MLLGLIGHPVKHSFSPLLHNILSKLTGVDCTYLLFDVLEEKLADAICGMRALNIRGLNVTLPYKESVIKYLDKVSKEASEVLAVNTIVNDNGILSGYNTDAEGFLLFLKECAIGIEGAEVLLIGGGGAARAVAWALAKLKPTKMYIFNRTVEKALKIKEMIQKHFGGITVEAFRLGCICDYLSEGSILINATSVGLNNNDPPLFDYTLLAPTFTAIDLIYNPPRTKLLVAAQQRGARVFNGFDMFIYQGILSFKLWAKVDLDIQKIKDIVLHQIKAKLSR